MGDGEGAVVCPLLWSGSLSAVTGTVRGRSPPPPHPHLLTGERLWWVILRTLRAAG